MPKEKPRLVEHHIPLQKYHQVGTKAVLVCCILEENLGVRSATEKYLDLLYLKRLLGNGQGGTLEFEKEGLMENSRIESRWAKNDLSLIQPALFVDKESQGVKTLPPPAPYVSQEPITLRKI